MIVHELPWSERLRLVAELLNEPESSEDEKRAVRCDEQDCGVSTNRQAQNERPSGSES